MPKRRRRRTRQPGTTDRIWQVFNPDTLRRICEMRERDFADQFGLEVTPVPQRAPADFYAFRDNDSSVLAVAHLDTVMPAHSRFCNFLETADGLVVYSSALDDRLGAYVILDLLPRLDINVDLLLTVGEESGQSTAGFFDAPKDYNWVIEFDRGGTDVVMYQYEDLLTRQLVKATGAEVGDGIFSDICYLEHLGVKAFNWGVGYRDYHSGRSHAYLDDTVMMVDHFVDFHAANADTRMEHFESRDWGWGRLGWDPSTETYYQWGDEAAAMSGGADPDHAAWPEKDL